MTLIRGIVGLALVATASVVTPGAAHAGAPVPTWGEQQRVSPAGVVVERAVVDSIEGQLVVARVQRPTDGTTCTLWVARETTTAASPVAQQVPGDLSSCGEPPTIGLSRNGSATLRIANRWSALRADDTWSPWRAAPTSSCGTEEIQRVIGLSRTRTAVVTSCPASTSTAIRHLRSRVYTDGGTTPAVHTLTARACAGRTPTTWDTSAAGLVTLAWGCRYNTDVTSRASSIDAARYVPGKGWRPATEVVDGLASRTWYFPVTVGVTPNGSSTVVFGPEGYTYLKARRANADGVFGSIYKIAPNMEHPGPACAAYSASVQSSGRIDIRWGYSRAFSRPALNLPLDASETFADASVDCFHEYEIKLSRSGLLWRATWEDHLAVRWPGQLEWSAAQDLFPRPTGSAGGYTIGISALGPDAHAYSLFEGALIRRVGTI